MTHVGIPPKMDFSLFPEDNIVTQHIKYDRRLTMGYNEYSVATSLSIISTMTQRKVCLELTTEDVYPNLMQVPLGLSSVSKKSTITKRNREFVYHLAPELLISSGPASSSAHFQDVEGSRRCNGNSAYHGKGIFYRDEAGGFLQEITKGHFPGIKDFICEIYDCAPFRRTYSNIGGKKGKDDYISVDIPEPFVNYVLVTTPDRFCTVTTSIDVSSGFLVRHIYYCPMYPTEFKKVAARTAEDNTAWGKLMARYEWIRDTFSAGGGFRVNFTMDEDVSDIYNKWLEINHKRLSGKDVSEGEREHWARLSIIALKIAMLLQIGSPEFKEEVEKGLKFGGVKLSKTYLEIAIKLCDGFYMPTFLYVMSMIGKNEEKNDLDKTMGILRRNGGCMRIRELMQKAHFKDMDTLGKVLGALEFSEEIVIYTDPVGRRAKMVAVKGHQSTPVDVSTESEIGYDTWG